MAEKAKKTTKSKKTATKTTTRTVTRKPEIKSSVTGKKDTWDKPAIGKVVCLCVGVIAIIVVMVAIMFGGQGVGIESFVSDSTKYVLNIPAEENEDGGVATHAIYYYKDDAITGMKMYYEFTDADTAKKFYDTLMESLKSDEENEEKATYKLNGKYVIAIADKSAYEELKASDIKAYIDLYEKYSNEEVDESESEEDEEAEE